MTEINEGRETRRTSMRLREPQTKRRETDQIDAKPQKVSSKTPAKRGRPTKKDPNAKFQTEDVQAAEEQEESKPKTILLPTKLVDGIPLPALSEPQSDKLKDSEWHSIADSGVLAASLTRSKQRWLSDGIFEKYWSKSTYKKKKEQLESNKTSAKDPRPNMTKVGTCKMIAEPHIFDVTFFVIKDTSAPQSQQQNDRQFVSFGPTNSSAPPGAPVQYQSPMSRPNQQPIAATKPLYPVQAATTGPPTVQTKLPHTFGSNTSQYSASSSTPASANPAQPMKPPSYSSSNQLAPSATSTEMSVPPATTPSTQYNTSQPVERPPSASVGGSSSHSSTSTHSSRPQPAPPARPPSTPTDPVIQMLASRAQKDHALKQVMKLVAANQATPDQLSYFQNHIDELTKIVSDRKIEEERRAKAIAAQQQNSGARAPYHVGLGAHQITNRPFAGHQQMQSHHTPPYRPMSTNTTQRPTYQPAPARTPRQVYIPPPQHVLMEFGQNSTDRFLFPKNAILEYDTKRTTVIASFLVMKKASELSNADSIDSKKSKKSEYKEKEKEVVAEDKTQTASTDTLTEPSNNGDVKKPPKSAEKLFYQPITIRFEAPSDANVLSTLGRVVAPAEQVRKHMLDIAEKAERSSTLSPVLRLPREAMEVQI